jgi:beta-1,4-mannosyl-glycoprotein beta-1,4-N-acetylglucosaminyltransferase
LDLLEIRLNELNDVVDYFVITEGENTFQGNDKELVFLNNKDRFSKFLHKIIHVVVPSSELKPGDNWGNERKSFNYFLNFISPNDDDVLILSALDEIPSKESITNIPNNTPCTISQGLYYFYLNTRYWTNNNNRWDGSVSYTYLQYKNSNINFYDLFIKKTNNKIYGGWHFSFLGDAKNAVAKVNSYSHSEYNELDESFYMDKINNLQDPFGRSNFTGFDFYEKNENLPEYVTKNIDRFFKYLRVNSESSKSSLTELGNKHGTDKSTYHNFTDFYDSHLSNFREKFTNILEIGIFNGSSLNMWSDYFINSKIHAVDIDDKSIFNSDRIITYMFSQTNKSMLEEKFNFDIDLIIDDGGHTMDQQQLSLLYLFDKVKSGGFYIIEDLHTSLRPGHYGNKNNEETTLILVDSLLKKSMFKSDYISIDQFNEILKKVEKVEIFENIQNDEFGKSITAIIYKK